MSQLGRAEKSELAAELEAAAAAGSEADRQNKSGAAAKMEFPGQSSHFWLRKWLPSPAWEGVVTIFLSSLKMLGQRNRNGIGKRKFKIFSILVINF